MTVTVANVDTTSDSFGQWVTKTNLIATALSVKAVTTDSNTAVGNAAVSSSFSANALFANTLSGGNNSVAANLAVSSNVSFTGARVSLGGGANVQINTGNSTFRVLTVNSSSSNTLVATKITFSDHSDVALSSPTNNHVLRYNSGNNTWYNSTTLVVYYANNTQAYP